MAEPIVSPNSRIRHPEHFRIGRDSIVDDYCYFSTRVNIGRCAHIASSCTIAGGPGHLFSLGDYSSVSAGVRVWCASNDFRNDLVVILPDGVRDIGAEPIEGDVIFAAMTGVGANAVIMPDNRIPEGTVIGALSFVPSRFQFEPWGVYAGTPLRRVSDRNEQRVRRQLQSLEAQQIEGAAA